MLPRLVKVFSLRWDRSPGLTRAGPPCSLTSRRPPFHPP